MKVNVVETRIVIYTFTKYEQDSLLKMGIWGYIYGRLKDNERIEIE
jgi:hypothetical protein